MGILKSSAMTVASFLLALSSHAATLEKCQVTSVTDTQNLEHFSLQIQRGDKLSIKVSNQKKTLNLGANSWKDGENSTMNWKFSSRNPYPWEMYQLEFEANGESLFLTFEGVGEFREATLYRSTGADSDYIATLQCEGRKASGDKEKIGLALAEIEHFINEDYLTHNGSTLLRSENLADVASDREAKMAELKKSVAEDFSGCSFDFRTSKTDVLSYLKSMDGESVAEIQSRLETLEKANQIAFVVQALWNGQKGDSEYCNVNRMILYTKAGFSLMISVEETD